MTRNLLRLCIGVLVLAPLVACESTKSANPLSPTVAGPIPGVNITPPKPLEPGNGWKLNPAKQPVTLLLENASSNGVRPLSYVFEVATDAAFGAKVFSKTGVAPGPAGRTSLQVSSLAAGRTITGVRVPRTGPTPGHSRTRWRSCCCRRSRFERPVPVSPVRGETVGVVAELRFKNAPRSGPVGAISYSLEVSRNEGFTAVVWRGGTGERGGESSATTGGLPASSTLFWRVRASDPENRGPWSSTASFVTSAAAPAPAPAPPAPSPPAGGGGSCASRDGEFIVECIGNKYPSYLKAGVSSSRRRSNMEFLRNRIIEAGICGGLELGWNLKRGGPDISVDFITERRGGLTYGYDIARDYDNTGKRLQLAWQNDGPHSVQKPYSPRPSCK